MSKLFINGPINVIRLEGQVNKINKIIYIFCDYHMPVERQTRCASATQNDSSVQSDDFVKYFIKTIKQAYDKKNGITYDLFFEARMSRIIDEPDIPLQLTRRQRYIEEFHKFFKSSINIVKTKNNNKTIIKNTGSKTNDNLRLHYVDFRDYLSSKINIILDEIRKILHTSRCNNHLSVMSANKLKHNLDRLKNEISLTTLYLHDRNNSDQLDLQYNIINHLLNKILMIYHHKDIHISILHSSLFKSLDKHIDLSYKYITSSQKLLDKYIKNKQPSDTLTNSDFGAHYDHNPTFYAEYIYKLTDDYYNYNIGILDTYAIIVDLYFLRRFLDKDYVTYAVTYTGIKHSINYLYTLVKYFDFKITHIAYSQVSIKKLEDIIKSSDYSSNFDKYLFQPVFSQCVNMTDFPKDFM